MPDGVENRLPSGLLTSFVEAAVRLCVDSQDVQTTLLALLIYEDDDSTEVLGAPLISEICDVKAGDWLWVLYEVDVDGSPLFGKIRALISEDGGAVPVTWGEYTRPLAVDVERVVQIITAMLGTAVRWCIGPAAGAAS